MDHSLQNKDRVIATCKALGGGVYINPIGGTELYDKKEFINEGIELQFIKADSIQYTQYNNSFIPNLSIIDVMMFNSKREIKKMLEHYSLQ